MGQDEIFTIRQLIELTGLSEFTLRGWETRYEAFQPQRSDTGRREYKKYDVEKALLLRELLKRGHKIGHLAKLKNQKLLELFEKAEAQYQAEFDDQRPQIVSRAMELLALQKWSKLKSLMQGVPTKNVSQFINDFLLPSLKGLVSAVDSGAISISQEHVFTSFLKEKIYSVLSDLETKKNFSGGHRKKNQFVLTTPEGDHHEMGLLTAHLLIRARGFSSLYMGPHTPAKDLSETALRYKASHLLIVSTVSKKGGARQEFLAFVSDVQKRLGVSMSILLAGSQAALVTRDSENSLCHLKSFQDLDKYLIDLAGEKVS